VRQVPLPKNPKKFWRLASLLPWLKREGRVRDFVGLAHKEEQSRAKEE
jgi:hypothetical protein